VEELSLMESYQDVKREGTVTLVLVERLHISCFLPENMRRMFYKWLAAARKVRHKRVILQEREEEMRKIRLEAAWDKWRGRFQEENLLPLVSVIRFGNKGRADCVAGANVHPPKSERDHVSRIRDLALQVKGNVPTAC
jgi:protein SFI1